MNERVVVFDEPALEFRYGQPVPDPRVGLSVFGPYDTDLPTHPRNLSLALVAPTGGSPIAIDFLRTIQSPIYPDEGLDPRLWPLYPGFEAAFECVCPPEPGRVASVNRNILDVASKSLDANERCSRVVDEYMAGIDRIRERDDRIDVILCIVPDFVHDRCRTESVIADGHGTKVGAAERRLRASGQFSLLETYDPRSG